MKRYAVWKPAITSACPGLWELVEGTDDLVEAIHAWEACNEEDEAVLTETMREDLDV